jgi:hypothetical protein
MKIFFFARSDALDYKKIGGGCISSLSDLTAVPNEHSPHPYLLAPSSYVFSTRKREGLGEKKGKRNFD